MAIALAIRGPESAEKRVDFDQTKVTIGSDPRCDVAITDPGVDPEQCVIVERDDCVELFDIGESGGVLLNGKPAGHCSIQPGDEIWIDRRETEPNAVRGMIERLHAENPKGSIVIQADEESTHEVLVIVMEAAKQAGVTNVAIAALND